MIRPATPDDVPALLELGAAMHAESPRFSRMTFDAARLERTLRALIDSDDGFVWLAVKDGDVVGGMVALVSQHWFSSDHVATDLALFVDPAARGSLAPARLVQAYRQWAHARGAVLVELGVNTGVHPEQTAALFERLGFRRCGVVLED